MHTCATPSAAPSDPISGPTVPTLHAADAVPAPATRTVTVSAAPPLAGACAGAKDTESDTSTYANATRLSESNRRSFFWLETPPVMSSGTPSSNPRSKPRTATRDTSLGEATVFFPLRVCTAKPALGVSTTTNTDDTKFETLTTASPKATKLYKFTPEIVARPPPAFGADDGTTELTTANSTRSHSGPLASRASREAASFSETYSNEIFCVASEFSRKEYVLSPPVESATATVLSARAGAKHSTVAASTTRAWTGPTEPKRHEELPPPASPNAPVTVTTPPKRADTWFCFSDVSVGGWANAKATSCTSCVVDPDPPVTAKRR
mmetsp:Transcript_8160/g.30593  ORF Transcript_8160/g.30593 Transcript_8160/m.30593 type:complete len:322 (+) Transcript_8160:6963-7928(+)